MKRPLPDSVRHHLGVCSLVVLLVVGLVGPLMSWQTTATASVPRSSAIKGVPYPLNNPGLEGTYATTSECSNITGEVAQGWGDNTCWDTRRPVISYARETTNPHSGTTAQRITLSSGNRVQFSQFLGTALDRGTRYTVSFWLRAQSSMFVTTYLRQSGGNYASYAGKIAKVPTSWTRYQFEGLVEDPSIVLLLTVQNPGTFWLDDVSITATSAATIQPPTPVAPVPRGYFGVHLNLQNTAWPNVNNGVGSVRVWDADRNSDGTGNGSQWTDINPGPGSYNWSGLDSRVARAQAQGADVLYTLGGRTPRWASGQPDAFSPYGPGQCAEPSSFGVWETWVREIATRYRGKIRLWEIWNEPDLSDFYCGNPDQLVQLAKRAAAVLRSVDPSNRVLSPGFSGYSGPAYLDYFLSHGGKSLIDAVDYHFYAETPELNAGARTINLRLVLARNGVTDKPLWNTEQGWINGVTAPVSQATGSAYIGRAHLINWAAGMGRFYYYYWDNQQFLPLVAANGVTLTQAGVAYREVVGWMTGNVMESLTIDARGTYLATLRTPSGLKKHALWNPASTVQASIPASWAATLVRDLAGGSRSIAGMTSLAIGESPVLLE